MKLKLKTFFSALILTLCAASLSSQNLITEDFMYNPMLNLAGTGGWFLTGSPGQSHVLVTSPGLTYAGYSGSGIANTASMINLYPGETLLRDFTTQTSGSVYYSFMLKISQIGDSSQNGYVTGFDQSGGATNYNTRLMIKKLTSSTYDLGLYPKPSGTTIYMNSSYSVNTTYLVVLKYTFVAGTGNDSASMFVFTSGVPAAEPAPNLTSVTGIDMVDEGQIFLNGNNVGGNISGTYVSIDGIRVGTSWQNTVITGIEPVSNEIPSGFKLEQNYPNPFNPATKIVYSIPQPAGVRITVYDILAREVATPVYGFHQPGTYSVEFNASGLSSGTYFYKIQAGNFTEVKKMVLVK